jgi:hypothetical protein
MLKDVLERQQAQLKSAEQQQERAEQNARGHIMGSCDENDLQEDTNVRTLTLEEDLALMENTDGNWDDSDDDEVHQLRHSASKTTLTSVSSSNDLRSVESPGGGVDVWDL